MHTWHKLLCFTPIGGQVSFTIEMDFDTINFTEIDSVIRQWLENNGYTPSSCITFSRGSLVATVSGLSEEEAARLEMNRTELINFIVLYFAGTVTSTFSTVTIGSEGVSKRIASALNASTGSSAFVTMLGHVPPSAKTNITLFLPNNAAIEAAATAAGFGSGDLWIASLTVAEQQLLIARHILMGARDEDELVVLGSATAVDSRMLTFSGSVGTLDVSDGQVVARVVAGGFFTSNNSIHIIDRVLMSEVELVGELGQNSGDKESGDEKNSNASISDTLYISLAIAVGLILCGVIIAFASTMRQRPTAMLLHDEDGQQSLLSPLNDGGRRKTTLWSANSVAQNPLANSFARLGSSRSSPDDMYPTNASNFYAPDLRASKEKQKVQNAFNQKRASEVLLRYEDSDDEAELDFWRPLSEQRLQESEVIDLATADAHQGTPPPAFGEVPSDTAVLWRSAAATAAATHEHATSSPGGQSTLARRIVDRIATLIGDTAQLSGLRTLLGGGVCTYSAASLSALPTNVGHGPLSADVRRGFGSVRVRAHGS